MITAELKQAVREAAAKQKENYKSQSAMAKAYGINQAQFSRAIFSAEEGNIISEANWISIARKLGVQIGANKELKAANTAVFAHITTQLAACKSGSLSGILCDKAGIGKSFTAKHFSKVNKNTIYIDCAQVKRKTKLVRYMAQEFGTNYKGRYDEVYDDLVYYIRTLENPMIIVDEAGDLDYSAFLELKGLWNATEQCCGWYMMGANGLKKKIEDGIGFNKVGFEEMFSRYGDKFQKITPDGAEAYDEFMRDQIHIIADANGVSEGFKELYAKTHGSLRRLRTILTKNTL